MPSTAMNVLMVTSEADPFAKSGGLADMVSALAKELGRKGADVRIVMPRYYAIDRAALKERSELLRVPIGFGEEWCGVFEGRLPDTEVPVYFLDQESLYGWDGIYGSKDEPAFMNNAKRFVYLSRGALQLCKQLDWTPDVVHVNDWATAPVPVFLNTWEKDGFFKDTGSLLTIHNLAYQGTFDKSNIIQFQLPWEAFHGSGFEFYDKMNFLKAGLHNADVLNTVSPGYAKEIQTPEYGCLLDGLLRDRKEDLYGILNGMDYDIWNPEHDAYLPKPFSAKELSGKALAKAALQKEAGLPEDPTRPLFGMVSRLTDQKGFGDLCGPTHGCLYSMCREMDIQVVLLGSGDDWCERELKTLSEQLPNFHAFIGYNNRLAHLIEGGSDFFLMPSKYEPCGLNQMYSLCYGTIPLVRNTGGLGDSVENYNEADCSGTGFVFDLLTPRSIYDTVGWACSTWYDRPKDIVKLRKAGMAKRFSWDRSADEYLKLYQKAMDKRRSTAP